MEYYGICAIRSGARLSPPSGVQLIATKLMCSDIRLRHAVAARRVHVVPYIILRNVLHLSLSLPLSTK